MIRSTSHGYLFVQLPHTGCSAVAAELIEHYDGEKILGKHATYREFERSDLGWTPRFVFSTVRHPLDDIVSTYEKLRTNHEAYDDPTRASEAPGGFVDAKSRQRFEFVATGADFETFVRRYHRLPYDNWSSLDHRRFDRVMRFENLADDFADVLSTLGIDAVRPLPKRNATARNNSSWVDYWDSPELRRFIAPRVAPFMEEWGYEFPVGWSRPGRLATGFSSTTRRALLPRRSRIWSQDAPVVVGD